VFVGINGESLRVKGKEGLLEGRLDLLLGYSDRGFVFHGTPKPDIKRFELHEASDLSGSSFNSDNAIYAVLHPVGAVMFAVMNSTKIPDDLRKGRTWSAGARGCKNAVKVELPRTWQPYLEDQLGYVYVLPNEGYVDDGVWQAKFKTEQIPVDIIKVQYQDFEALGGTIIYKD